MPSSSDGSANASVSRAGARAKTAVLHVLAPMQHGGLERVVSMMSIGQRTMGVHVAPIVTPSDAKDHAFIAHLKSQGVAVTPIVVGSRSYLREYRMLRDLIVAQRPQVVHSHGYRPDVVAVRAAHAAGVPVVSTVHGFTGGSLRNRLYELVQRRALRRADAVIAVSPQIATSLVAAGVDRAKVFHIANGFSPVALPERNEARRALNLAADQKVVGWVGRLSHEKGADVMLDAFAHGDGSWHLAMIGEGPERAELQRHASSLGVAPRVTWHGALPDAAKFFPAFDVFVISSRTEGTPISLFEAMQARVPVVTTAVGNIPNVVSEREARLVPPEGPPAIAEAVRSVFSDSPSAAARAENALRRLTNEFSVRRWLAAVDKVYDSARANYANR